KVIFGLILLFWLGTSLHSTPDFPKDEKASEVPSDAFDTMMEVIAHKRCVNCHPSDDYPRQGEDSHLHLFDVQRGKDGHGLAALSCETCHQEENNYISGVPGAPNWHLAPRSMGWSGLSKAEIAQAMMDPAKNGNRSPTEIEKHLTEDPLVLWVFEPGVNYDGIPREKPPVSKQDYITAVKEWIDGGAVIPNE
ncbi:MAG: hypothetical protein AAF598_07420, partial [Bacteroidota bacterium]